MGCDFAHSCDCDNKEDACDDPKKKNSIWYSVLGEYGSVDCCDETPDFSFVNAGVLLVYDRYGDDLDLFSGGVGYLRTNLDMDNSLGDATIDQFFAVLSGMVEIDWFYLDLALWGGTHRVHNERNVFYPGYDETAVANYNGWQLSPHVEFGCKIDRCWFVTEPFLAFDWANNWKESFIEHGASPFNMKQESQYSSMLKSELGFRFYECVNLPSISTIFIFKEKLSYVNKTPFGTGEVIARATDGICTFSIESCDRSRNHLAAGFEFLIVPMDQNTAYLSFGYDGEYFDGYQSHEGIAKLVFNF